MKKFLKLKLVLLFLIGTTAFSAPITIGLIQHEYNSLDDGYVLFSTNNAKLTYLIDKCGFVINKWESNYRPAFSSFLLKDGTLLRTGTLQNPAFIAGGTGGIIEKYDWDGNVIWHYQLSDNKQCMHHDIKPMPNGNILAVVWDKRSKIEAITYGRNPDNLDSCIWSEKIVELRPVGTDSAEIVWEWKVWDHLVQDYDSKKPFYGKVSEHPELINLNFPATIKAIDWLHFNCVDYNEELDQIMITANIFSEIWIVDHSTTTAEAKKHTGGKYGKGGDLLYRWGNPQAYGRGTNLDQKFFLPHDANWIPKGYHNENCISIFNNQRFKNNIPFSSADIFMPDVDSNGVYNSSSLPYGPNDLKWSYYSNYPGEFFSSFLGSVQQLSNGNVLVCDGMNGNLFEVDSTKNEAWYYINPVTINGIMRQGEKTMGTNQVFRCTYLPNDYPAFTGKDMTRKGIIEDRNRLSNQCALNGSGVEDEQLDFAIYPNPSSEYISIETEYSFFKVVIMNLQGEKLITKENETYIDLKDLESGIYIVCLTNNSGQKTYRKIVVYR